MAYADGTLDYNNASNTLDQARKAYAPSVESFDSAAARVRNRLNAQSAGNADQISSQFARRRLYNSGMQKNLQQQNRRDTQNAYAGGLVDLTDKFQERDIQRAQGLANVGQQYANIGQARDQTGATYRGQDLNQALGLGQLDLTRRGQDIDQSTALNAQRIQESLGNATTLKDLMASQLEFGNTKLNTGGQQTVDQIIKYLLSKAV